MRCRTWVMILLLASGVSRQLYPQGAVNVDPNIPRPPLLLSLPAAEANRQVRELALMTLIQGLQTGDPEQFQLLAGDMAIEEPETSVPCRSVSEGMHAVQRMQASRREGPAEPLRIRGERITERDSAGMTITDLQLVVTAGTGAEARSPVRLTYDNVEARWRASKGIVESLCGSGGKK